MSHPYYTHRKCLINSLNSLSKKSKVNILEFGVGDGSSFILNEFAAKNKNFNITAYEIDRSWLEDTKSKYELDNYKFVHINEWDDLLVEKNFCDRYDLVFIDQSPWEARIKTLDLLIDKSKTIILHDYDYYNKGVIGDIFDVGVNSFFGKYLNSKISAETYTEELPPTLVFKKK